MALGLLFSGLSGAGKGLAASAEQDQRVYDEQRLMAERSRLDEEKANRIAEAQANRQRQAGIKQGQDIDLATTNLQNERDAAAINASNSGVEGGSSMSPADAQVLRNQPEARKAYGLLTPTRQSDLEDRATAAEKLGYLDAAKETRGQLQTEVTNQRNQAIDESTNKRLDQQDAANKATQQYQQRREDRLDRLASAQLEFSKARANKDDARAEQMADREQRSATVAAMKGVETDLKILQRDMADPMLQPEQKAVLQGQKDQLMAEHNRYRSALAGAGIDNSAKPDKPFNPADFRTGKPAGGNTPSKGVTTVDNPVQQSSAPSTQESPKDMAVKGLDAAINTTVRSLAAANNRGDKQEAARLNSLLQEQQAAKAKL